MRFRRKNRQEQSEAPAGYNFAIIFTAIFATMGGHPHICRNKAAGSQPGL